jgi:hypothetical protein
MGCEMIATWKIFSDKMGGFNVRKDEGPRYAYLGALRGNTTPDCDRAASFNTRAQAKEFVEDWVEPGTLARMSRDELSAYIWRYKAESQRMKRELLEAGADLGTLAQLTNEEMGKLLERGRWVEKQASLV